MSEVSYQLVTSAICVVVISVWIRVGRMNRAVGWWAALPIIAAVATMTYYLLAFFSDWNETDLRSFLAWGAALRLFTFLMIAAGGLTMLRRNE